MKKINHLRMEMAMAKKIMRRNKPRKSWHELSRSKIWKKNQENWSMSWRKNGMKSFMLILIISYKKWLSPKQKCKKLSLQRDIDQDISVKIFNDIYHINYYSGKLFIYMWLFQNCWPMKSIFKAKIVSIIRFVFLFSSH